MMRAISGVYLVGLPSFAGAANTWALAAGFVGLAARFDGLAAVKVRLYSFWHGKRFSRVVLLASPAGLGQIHAR